MICEDLKGKKVLVTGSSSGIGAAAAILFSQQACFVGVHYFKTKDGGEKTLTEVKKHSDGILLQADIRDEKQVTDMVEQFAKAAGGIDILVNNAGSLIDRQNFEDGTVDYHNDVYATVSSLNCFVWNVFEVLLDGWVIKLTPNEAFN